MGLKKKFSKFFPQNFHSRGPQGLPKFFQKNLLWVFLISLEWSYCCNLKALEIRVLEMKKSPKKDGKWLSYCNFSFAKSDFYFLKK